MTRFLIRRLLSGLVVLFVFVTIVFFLVQIIIPGDFVSQFALSLSPSQAEGLRHQLGLDLPIWQRYLLWLNGLIHGDLGRSYTLSGEGAPIFETLKPVIPPSVLVFGIGTVIAFLLGLWLGKVTAWRGPGFLSSSATFGAITLYTSFPPWLAFLAVYFYPELIAPRPTTVVNAVGRPRVVINGSCLDYLAESFMAGDPLHGGGFVILNGIEFDEEGNAVDQATPYPGSNLFSLASGGAIYLRDPYDRVVEDPSSK